MKVDFLVKGQRLESAILTLSSASSAASHTFANEVFRRWHDLDDSERTKQRVTVFDDRHDAYRVEDLNRIRSAQALRSTRLVGVPGEHTIHYEQAGKVARLIGELAGRLEQAISAE